MSASTNLTLEIEMLGPLQARLAGAAAEFRTDAERALLAYLAAHQGAAQRRDTLAGLLSPDRPDAEALTYLRNRLARLREALADERARPPWLAIDRKQIALRAGGDIAVDLTRFEQHLAAVDRHAHRQLAGCPACLAQLQAAADLVRGELLAGLNFGSDTWQEWLATQREHYRQRTQDALTRLREARLTRGEWAAALEIAQRQLGAEPWLEPAHRAAMIAQHQLGDRNAALAQYERCEQSLWGELGVEPEAATQQLRQQILDGALALASHADPLNNLPPQTGLFFGRHAEQAQLLQRLVEPSQRLVTIVGAGGVGKTRLSIEAGAQVNSSFPDGVWFVELGAVGGGAEQIKVAIGAAAGLEREHKQLTGEQVLAMLRDKRALLILDSCELLLGELAFVPEWLRRAPQLAILATSREPLNLAAEAVLALGGLPTGAAEALFAERGRMARSEFVATPEHLPLVRQICELVDGSPLGIALAAAWLRRRSLKQIRDEIGRSIDFLSTRMRDADARHHSMRAVFEASWQLLTPGEQAVLAALSVFPESFTAAAAAAVARAGQPGLDALCEKSLLQQQHEPERYQLHSLLRQFAAEKLAQAAPNVDRAFVEYFHGFARAHQHNYGELQPEWRNLSAAIGKAHALAAWQHVLELAQLLDEPWFRQIRFGDMRAGLGLALDAAAALGDQPALARALLRLGEVEIELNHYPAAEAHLAEALRHLARLEDSLGIAHSQYFLARIKLEQAHDQQAIAFSLDSKRIFEEEHDWLGVAKNLNLLALCHMSQNPDFATAQAHLAQSVALQRRQPPTATYAEALRYLARVNSVFDEYDAAEACLMEATAICRALQDIGEYAAVLFDRVVLCRRRNDYDAALAAGAECLELFQRLGSLRWQALVNMQLALLHQANHKLAPALALFRDCQQLFAELGDRYEQAYACYFLSKLYDELGEPEQSQLAKQQAAQLNRTVNDPELGRRLQ